MISSEYTKSIILLVITVLFVIGVGYYTWPEKGVCTLIGMNNTVTNNPCKRLLTENNIGKLIGLNDIGTSTNDCIRINGIDYVDDCLLSYTTVKILYNTCVSNYTFREYITKHSLINYTDIRYGYVYNFKNDKHDINVTKSYMLSMQDGRFTIGSIINPCYYYEVNNDVDNFNITIGQATFTLIFGVFGVILALLHAPFHV